MSIALRIIGVVFALIGIGVMISTIYMPQSGEITIGNKTSSMPTSNDIQNRIPVLVVGAVVMFIGFGIIYLGWWRCRE